MHAQAYTYTHIHTKQNSLENIRQKINMHTGIYAFLAGGKGGRRMGNSRNKHAGFLLYKYPHIKLDQMKEMTQNDLKTELTTNRTRAPVALTVCHSLLLFSAQSHLYTCKGLQLCTQCVRNQILGTWL